LSAHAWKGRMQRATSVAATFIFRDFYFKIEYDEGGHEAAFVVLH
jgi:hypothetical protein